MSRKKKPLAQSVAERKPIPATTIPPFQSAPMPSVRIVSEQRQWEGPLPPPDQLAKFSECVPNGADRVMRMAEDEGAHTRYVQTRSMWGSMAIVLLGQLFAITFAGSALYGAYCLAMAGHDWVAGAMCGGGLAPVVLAFISGRKPDSEKRPK